MTGKDLKEIRVNILGYSQLELSRILGIGNTTLCQWEKEDCKITFPKMLQLALMQISLTKRDKIQKFIAESEIKSTHKN